MADLEKTVSIIFSGTDDGLSGTVSSVSGGFGSLNDKLMSVAQPLANVADGVLTVDAALLALAIGGLALATNEAGKFQTAFAEISTLLDANPVQLEQFSDDILDYALTSVKGLTDIEKATYAAISAGVDYTDSLEFLKTSEQLAVAGRADLKDVTVLLASTLNAYGESTDQATRYSDVFFKTVKLGQTTIPELSTSLSNLTGISASAGVPIETLSAAIAALTATGLPTEQAITGLKAALSNIIKPTSDAAKTADALGLSFNAGAISTKGLEGVLWDAYAATGGNIDQMSKLFGSVEGLNAVMILGADQTGKFKNAITEMGNSTGAAAAAYDKMVNEYEAVNTRFANNVQVTLIEIGEKTSGAYAEIVNALGGVVSALGGIVDADSFAPVQAEIDDFAKWMSSTLDQIARALPDAWEQVDFKGLMDALDELGLSLSDLFGDVDLTTPEGLADALQMVVDAGTLLINVTSGMVDSFKPVIEAFINWIEVAGESDTQAQETIGMVLGVAKAFTDAGGLIGAAIIAIGQNAETAERVWNTFLGTVQLAWNGFQIAFESLALAITDMALMVIQTLDTLTFGQSDWLQEAEKTLSGYRDTIVKAIQTDSADAVHGLEKAWVGVTGQTELAKDSTELVGVAIKEIPDNKITAVEIAELDKFFDDHNKALKALNEIPDEKSTALTASVDEPSIQRAGQLIVETLPGEFTTIAIAKADTTSLEKTKKDVTDISKSLESAFEWQAKLDIAEVEANAQKVEALAKSISDIFGATGDTIAAAFAPLAALDANDTATRSYIMNVIDQELAMQQQALDLQRELTEAEIRYTDAKTRSLDSGQALLTVSGDGLQPHLEAFMWEVLSAIQVSMNQDMADYLMGVSGA